MEMHVGPNSTLLSIGCSPEALVLILTFNMDRFIDDRSSLMFIDVNVRQNMHFEIKIDP